jgi:diguanylate cyclase (GGDEF)-like protein
MARRAFSPIVLTIGITTSLAAIAVWLVGMSGSAPLLARGHLSTTAVAIGIGLSFALVELGEISVEFRQHAYSFTLAHIPMVIGLLLCDPRQVLVARALGSLVAFVLQRADPLKSAYNLASYGAEIGLQMYAMHVLLPAHPVLDGATALLTVAVVCLGDIVMSALVLGMVRIHGISLTRQDLIDVVAPVAVTTTGTTGAALIAVLLLSHGTLGITLLLLALAVLAVVARSYRALFRRHQDLAVIHEFVAATTDVEDDVAVAELLSRTRAVMGAESVQLTLNDDGKAPMVLRLSGEDDGRVAHATCEQLDWLVACVRTQREPLLVPHTTRDPAKRAWLAEHAAREALLVPVERPSGAGVLVAFNRTAGTGNYARSHLSLLATLAGHLAVALENSELLGRLRFEASHDPLTGLGNRTVISRQLCEYLERSGAEAASGLAVLLLDLDRFKEVNDTLGHYVGDQLLQVIADRLLSVIPSRATIARLGGDEFAVILPDLADAELEARTVAEAIVTELAAPVWIEDALISPRASIGIACVEAAAHAVSARKTSDADLLRHADTAMYAAKASATSVEIYSETMDHGRAERLALLADLHIAIDQNQFVLRYQPQVDVGLGRITSVEALVRWQHPQLGLLTPDAFIGLAETTGLIEPLTRIVVTCALQQCRSWAEQGIDLAVAVNLSARSVTNEELPTLIARWLQESGVPASKLILEITESSVMGNPEQARRVLERLADLGVTLSLDDFGTGHSSLSYLQRLPFREVKIDRSFIRGLTIPEEARASLLLTRSIINLARGLELRVVAEGVEDAELLAQLTRLGVDMLQGYYLGRPMEPEQIVRRMSSDSPAQAIALPAIPRARGHQDMDAGQPC